MSAKGSVLAIGEIASKGGVVLEPDPEVQWKLEKCWGGKVALKAYNNCYLRADRDDLNLVNLVPHCRSWEKWRLIELCENKRVCFQSKFGTYLQARPDGTLAQSHTRGDWELWARIALPGNMFAFKSIHDRFLQMPNLLSYQNSESPSLTAPTDATDIFEQQARTLAELQQLLDVRLRDAVERKDQEQITRFTEAQSQLSQALVQASETVGHDLRPEDIQLRPSNSQDSDLNTGILKPSDTFALQESLKSNISSGESTTSDLDDFCSIRSDSQSIANSPSQTQQRPRRHRMRRAGEMVLITSGVLIGTTVVVAGSAIVLTGGFLALSVYIMCSNE